MPRCWEMLGPQATVQVGTATCLALTTQGKGQTPGSAPSVKPPPACPLCWEEGRAALRGGDGITLGTRGTQKGQGRGSLLSASTS